MNDKTWTSETVDIAPTVHVDVRANARSIALCQGNDVWFHDLHMDAEMADAIADKLKQGAAKHREMKARSAPTE